MVGIHAHIVCALKLILVLGSNAAKNPTGLF